MQSCSWGGDDIYEILSMAVRSETKSAALAAHIKSVEITTMMVSPHPLCPSACCQRQQGRWPSGSTSVSLTPMAQAACCFTFSPPSHTCVKLRHVLHLFLLHCVTVSCCRPLPDRWSVCRSPLLICEETFGFATQACTADRCRKSSQAESRSISTLRKWNRVPAIVPPLSRSWASTPAPPQWWRLPALWKNSAPAQISDLLTFPTRCWWPVHHTQLSICISNPEGVKEPRFVILDKQKPAVRQGVVFKAAEGLDGCHSTLTLSSSVFMLQTPDDKGAQGEIN